ncbi:hypothetical protein P261_02275 [Lachnospiraceae bacterium TWA4]|nr:hypothetical protein P261_02275 [Lachnospiraceae bacterium TWA4]
MSIKFEDYSNDIKNIIKEKSVAWLTEASGEIEAQTKRNCTVVTGKTKGSFTHVVDEEALEGHIGSNYDNAIWEEFGTGLYALEGNGRKTPWIYKDSKGKTYRTVGKKPKRMLHNAYHSLKGVLESSARSMFGGLK